MKLKSLEYKRVSMDSYITYTVVGHYCIYTDEEKIYWTGPGHLTQRKYVETREDAEDAIWNDYETRMSWAFE